MGNLIQEYFFEDGLRGNAFWDIFLRAGERGILSGVFFRGGVEGELLSLILF